MHYWTVTEKKKKRQIESLKAEFLLDAALNFHIQNTDLMNANVTVGRKMGIYVCDSLREGPSAPSGDTQGQRGIDGVNSVWQRTEIQLFLSPPPSLSLSYYLRALTFYLIGWELYWP